MLIIVRRVLFAVCFCLLTAAVAGSCRLASRVVRALLCMCAVCCSPVAGRGVLAVVVHCMLYAVCSLLLVFVCILLVS